MRMCLVGCGIVLQRLPLWLENTIQIPIVPPSEREGDHVVVEGANGGG